jgi:hypothetical protein
MNRSGWWRKGVAFDLILLMVFMAAAISAPVVEAQWTEGDPHYTYDYHYPFSPTLEPGGGVHSLTLTIGIVWGDAAERPVTTGMTAIFVYPDYGADHLDIAFDPSTFTLGIGETQTVVVTVSAKEEAECTNYIIQIEAVDLGGENPVIFGFSPIEGGWCNINPLVVTSGGGVCYPAPSGGEGCFIATAAYGTSTAEEIDTLRAFRDGVLLQNSLGSHVVDFYYEVSPPVADFISENSFLRTLVREVVVDPVVSLVEATEAIWGN